MNTLKLKLVIALVLGLVNATNTTSIAELDRKYPTVPLRIKKQCQSWETDEKWLCSQDSYNYGRYSLTARAYYKYACVNVCGTTGQTSNDNSLYDLNAKMVAEAIKKHAVKEAELQALDVQAKAGNKTAIQMLKYPSISLQTREKCMSWEISEAWLCDQTKTTQKVVNGYYRMVSMKDFYMRICTNVCGVKGQTFDSKYPVNSQEVNDVEKTLKPHLLEQALEAQAKAGNITAIQMLKYPSVSLQTREKCMSWETSEAWLCDQTKKTRKVVDGYWRNVSVKDLYMWICTNVCGVNGTTFNSNHPANSQEVNDVEKTLKPHLLELTLEAQAKAGNSTAEAIIHGQKLYPGRSQEYISKCISWKKQENWLCGQPTWRSARDNYDYICTNVCGVSGRDTSEPSNSWDLNNKARDLDQEIFFHEREVRREQKERKEILNGASISLKNDNTTTRGDVTADINVGRAVTYNQAWAHWFEVESQEPAAQQLAGHLNNASKSAGWAFVQQQQALSHESFDLVKSFSDYTLGHKDCNQQVYAYCLKNTERPCWPRITPNGTLENHQCWGSREARPFGRRNTKCAKAAGCFWAGGYEGGWRGREHMSRRRALHKKIHASFEKIKMAEKFLAKSIAHDVETHVLNQEKNAITIAKNYTTEVRERLTAYGCNTACVNRCTESPRSLIKCNLCDCPSTITVHANPADTAHTPLHEYFQ